MKQFPDKIFDGTHQQRPEMASIIPPEFLDYVILTRELASTQEYLLNLSNNISVMPDLKGIIDSAMVRVDDVNAAIKKLTPPARLTTRLNKLADKVNEVDSRKPLAGVRSELASLRDTIDTNQLRVLKLQESFAKDVKGFQNKMLNMFKKLEQEAMGRLDTLEEKMSKVHLQAEVGNLLNRLENMK